MEKWDKIENEIKEKFEKTTITPSSGLWSAIEKELEPPIAEVKIKKNLSWFWMAASVMVFFGLSYFFVFTAAEDKGSRSLKPVGEKQLVTEADQQIQRVDPVGEKGLHVRKAVVGLIPSEVKSQVHSVDQPLQVLKPDTASHPNVILNYVKGQEYNLDAVIVLVLEQNDTNYFKVDAKDLLKEVETELKVEYRETVFGQLKRNFKEAKTNFANRNYE